MCASRAFPSKPRLLTLSLRPSVHHGASLGQVTGASVISTRTKRRKRSFQKKKKEEEEKGKEWRHRRIRKITDRAFDRLANQSEKAKLTFEDLYIAVLLVYNDLNKHLPGPHFDPPSKDKVREVIKDCDMNLDGEIDRNEFYEFIKRMTADTFTVVSQGLVITLVVAPTVAMATKRATEGVPGVGKVVQRLPNSVYASLVTLAVVMFQNLGQESL